MKNKSNEKIIMDGVNLKIGIVTTENNWEIVEKLFNGALDILSQNNVRAENVIVLKVPTIFEIPFGCQRMAQSKEFDALIALGCSDKNETDYYYFVTTEVTRALMDLGLRESLPVGYGIISAEEKRILKRNTKTKNNAGYQAGENILKMIKII